MSLFDDIRDQNPGLTEQEILDKLDQIPEVNAATPVAPEIPPAPMAHEMAPGVQDPKAAMYANLRQKYNLDQYSADKRKALADDAASAGSSPINAVLAGLSGLGAGIAGRDVSSGFKSAMDLATAGKRSALDTFDKNKEGVQKDYDFEKSQIVDNRSEERTMRENDPNSVESKMAQDLAISMGMSPDIAKGLTASKFQQLSPVMQKKYEIEQKKLERQDALRSKMEETRSKKMDAATEGQKAVDRDFAKDYNDWTSGGQATVDKNIQRLKDARTELAKSKDDLIGTSGRITGRLPDFARSERSLKLRQDVQAAAQGALKATLGAQFTEKEGERIMAAAYDEKLSPEANIEKIDAAIKELETGRANKNDKSRHFEESGSLRGYKSQAAANPSPAPKGSRVRVSNGAETLEIDESDLADAQKDGFKRI